MPNLETVELAIGATQKLLTDGGIGTKALEEVGSVSPTAAASARQFFSSVGSLGKFAAELHLPSPHFADAAGLERATEIEEHLAGRIPDGNLAELSNRIYSYAIQEGDRINTIPIAASMGGQEALLYRRIDLMSTAFGRGSSQAVGAMKDLSTWTMDAVKAEGRERQWQIGREVHRLEGLAKCDVPGAICERFTGSDGVQYAFPRSEMGRSVASASEVQELIAKVARARDGALPTDIIGLS